MRHMWGPARATMVEDPPTALGEDTPPSSPGGGEVPLIGFRHRPRRIPRARRTVSLVRAFRRALFAFLAAGLVAGAIRLRGRGGVPPQGGGWRELSPSELDVS